MYHPSSLASEKPQMKTGCGSWRCQVLMLGYSFPLPYPTVKIYHQLLTSTFTAPWCPQLQLLDTPFCGSSSHWAKVTLILCFRYEGDNDQLWLFLHTSPIHDYHPVPSHTNRNSQVIKQSFRPWVQIILHTTLMLRMTWWHFYQRTQPAFDLGCGDTKEEVVAVKRSIVVKGKAPLLSHWEQNTDKLMIEAI